jgi:ketosteroid isomerase-like protein
MKTAFLLLAASLTAAATAAPPASPLDEVVAAERAFAQYSREHGVRSAFENFMVDDTVIYRPGPVAGRPFYAKAPEQPIALDWAPERAGIAASGDLAFTTGPYTLAAKAEPGKIVGSGHFLSVWQRNAQGNFDNVIDVGIKHGEQPLAKEVARLGPAPAHAAPPLDPAAYAARLQMLLRADRALAERLACRVGQAALSAAAASDALVMRDGRLPTELSELALAPVALPAMDLAAIRLSTAGDLGATSGWNGDPKAPKSYLRIWRWTEQGWRVVVDLLS